MNRRKFLQQSLAATAAAMVLPNAALGQPFSSAVGEKKLTILHTNDQHSRIEPFDSTYVRNPNQGGFARRAALISKIRKEEPNLLLLDSGDIFQGTPYFNFYGGELEFRLMSMMGYDASTMGNHDFDNGLSGFRKVLPNAKFPFLCANYDFSNTELNGLTFPNKIFVKDGLRVGIFGLGIELAGLVGKKQYLETKYLDPVEMATEQVRILREQKKCHLVICLSHLGYDYRDNPQKISDQKLAAQTRGIDLILGGHTHTFLKEPVAYQNLDGKEVLVNQVGWAGLLLGRIEFYFDRNRQVKNVLSQTHVIDGSILV